MLKFQIQSLDVVASYNQIDPSMTMRPLPAVISDAVFRQISPSLDFAAAFSDLRTKVYEVDPATLPSGQVAAKAAAIAARVDIAAALNAHATGFTIAMDQTFVAYRRTSSGSHETVNFLLKSEGGLPEKPWPFSVNVADQTIDGFVAITSSIGALVPAESSGSGGDQVQKSVSKPITTPNPSAPKQAVPAAKPIRAI